MTKGWGEVAAAMGRSEEPDEAVDTPGEARSATPAGWEALGRPQPSPAPPVAAESDAAESVADSVGAQAVDDEADDGDGYADDGDEPLPLAARFDDLRRDHPRALLGSAGGVLVVIAAVVIALVVTASGGLPAGAAFSVNGKVTTQAQLASQIAVLDQLDSVTAPAKTNKAAYATFLRTSAHALAVQQLVTQLATKQGIVVSDKSTRDQLDQIVSSQYGGDRTKLDSALSSAGLSEQQILTALRTQGLENTLYGKVTKAVTVTDAQVSDAFNANQSSFSQPEQRAVSIILVATQATGTDVLNQLTSGTDFATLAEQDSLDTSKSSGGAVGTFTQDQLANSGLGPSVFAATQGTPFGPVQVAGGEWVVGEVTAITPATQYGNDAQTQAGIKNYLTDQQLRSQWIAYLGKQLRAADISYASAYRPANPLQPPQPALPSMAQFVVNAHSSSATSGAAPTSP